MLVADGVGGHRGGASAAALAVEAASQKLQQSRGRDLVAVLEAVEAANMRVQAERLKTSELREMATTLTVAAATEVTPKRSAWVVANIGDSPAWLACRRGLFPVVDLQNVAAELERAGVISAEQSLHHRGRHQVTQAIGPRSAITPGVKHAVLYPGDRLIVASDGIDALGTRLVFELTRAAPTAQAAAEALVAAAVPAATDNVTAVVAEHQG